MKHVSELTTQRQHESAEPTLNTSAESSNRLTEKHIALLWQRMTMIYGHKWASSYGESDDGTWLKGLHDVTTEQCGLGLEKLRVSEQPWPPTLPEFRALCKPNTPAYHKPFPKLIEAPRNPEIAELHLANLKKACK